MLCRNSLHSSDGGPESHVPNIVEPGRDRSMVLWLMLASWSAAFGRQ